MRQLDTPIGPAIFLCKPLTSPSAIATVSLGTRTWLPWAHVTVVHVVEQALVCLPPPPPFLPPSTTLTKQQQHPHPQRH